MVSMVFHSGFQGLSKLGVSFILQGTFSVICVYCHWFEMGGAQTTVMSRISMTLSVKSDETQSSDKSDLLF